MENRISGPLGTMTALITPFDENGRIDFNAFERLLNFQIKAGVDAVVVAGTTGESSSLTAEEQIDLVAFAVGYCKDSGVKVVAGAGANCTAEADILSVEMYKLGVDAILSVVPYYVKTTQEGLYQHFAEIAKAVPDMPIILYNVPGRTVNDLNPGTTVRLFNEFPNIYALKHASVDTEALDYFRIEVPDLAILSGEDDLNVKMMELGAKGCISVVSNVLPKTIKYIIENANNPDVDLTLLKYDFISFGGAFFREPNPIPVKYILHKFTDLNIGLNYRLPLVEPSELTKGFILTSLDLGLDHEIALYFSVDVKKELDCLKSFVVKEQEEIDYKKVQSWQ